MLILHLLQHMGHIDCSSYKYFQVGNGPSEGPYPRRGLLWGFEGSMSGL